MTHYLVGLAVVFLTVVGDYFLKRGSLIIDNPYWNVYTLVGGIAYFSTAFGWVYMMSKMNLAVVGVVYSCMTIVILTTMGVMVFKEPLTARQIVGVVFAVAAVLITFEQPAPQH